MSVKEVAEALVAFSDIDEAEGGNHHVIRTERRAAELLLDLDEIAASSQLAEMKSAAGYLRNAKIDLETGCTKATAIRTIEGGLKRLEAAIDKATAGVSAASRREVA